MSARPGLFRNIHDRDFLGFWADQTLQPRKVFDFLDLKKPDLAKLAGVSTQSVRFDHKMPREVMERLNEIANICGLVAQFFAGDVNKTALWFQTKNSLLGDVAPRDMIWYGRAAKLREFIIAALDENEAMPSPSGRKNRRRTRAA